jgi:hypothetical protein
VYVEEFDRYWKPSETPLQGPGRPL